jgi:RimJ/RimL family protein N-acetyltransferase
MADLKPALPPERITLEGRYCRLEPIGLQHVQELYAATSGEGESERYQWLFDYPPASVRELTTWVGQAALREDQLAFAIIDKANDRCGGRQTLMRIAANEGSIEIGGVLWGRGVSRTRVATEALYLFARYVFEDLGFRRFEWKCNDLNTPSKRAATRFGFIFEGIFRQHMILKGQNRDTAWFSMLDHEWPRRKAGFEAWLDPANFDADGTQLTKLKVRDEQ